MKAILVLNEMPNSCSACPLTYIDYGDDAYYGANTTRCVIDKDTIPHHGKWDECPLKPLPSKKVPVFDPNSASYDEEYEKRIMNEIDGWNACIKELEK